MREFTQNMRLRMVSQLTEAFHLLNGGVHRAYHITDLSFAIFFVMNKPCWVSFSAPLRHRPEIAAEAGLIPKRPEDHGRMILVALDHSLNALHVGFLPGRIIAESGNVA
ncbi:hypothetical protein D3C71_1279360 [compost metagenome]